MSSNPDREDTEDYIRRHFVANTFYNADLGSGKEVQMPQRRELNFLQSMAAGLNGGDLQQVFDRNHSLPIKPICKLLSVTNATTKPASTQLRKLDYTGSPKKIDSSESKQSESSQDENSASASSLPPQSSDSVTNPESSESAPSELFKPCT